MTGPSPSEVRSNDVRETRRRSLRRQIGIVAALILCLSVVLAVVSYGPRLQPVVGGKIPDRTAKEAPASAEAAPSVPAQAPLPAPAPVPPAAADAAIVVPGPATPPPAVALPASPEPAPSQAPPVVANLPPGPVAAKPGDERPPRLSLTADDSATGRRHFVQLGIFMQQSNAETLRARLQQQGIPALLETRVRVGPFATRDEALAAQARLRDLGFDPGAIIPLKP